LVRTTSRTNDSYCTYSSYVDLIMVSRYPVSEYARLV